MAVVFFVSGCSKHSGPDPAKDELVITDGSACKLPNLSQWHDIGLGFPRDPNRQKSTGTVKVAVIFVDFSDAVASRTPQEVFSYISPASENFLNSVSYGALNVVFEPKFKWYRMSKPSSAYGWDHLTFQLHQFYIQEAVNLADPEYDFSKTDEIVVVSNPDGGVLFNGPTFMGMPTNGISADGRIISNAITSGRDLPVFTGLWFPHEFGHSMGLPDLYRFSAPQQVFVGDFSLMANILGTAPNQNAWEKWFLRWFSDSQVTCVDGKGTGSLQLTPVELKDGMKLLVLPIDESRAVIVEDRRPLGYDNRLVKAGPLVYVIDTKIDNGFGPLRLLPINENDQARTDAPLSVGQSITYGSIIIKCTTSDADGSTVTYQRQ
ncbi:MAG TPA: hypothetical protein VHA56_20670 [Mucilaginibacter sp.]|nr:hypothetical protein [Mucilaginibacter sp.]